MKLKYCIIKLKKIINNNIAFMHCISSYPAKVEQLNIDVIFEMKKFYQNA